ncbi:hypothetical protein IMCC3317_33940 [Kordia antarctica]|uniref:Uncharacterized protein n=1 Tax=Kordia antarctica TaxID=1218801 RepID=A0A7L4ZND6_9FLAO|nr:hypothetical protein [Kordia antarctica]QHI38011.1 hypothetical protein IMCC3317_33940 [Kordia antarctica]
MTKGEEKDLILKAIVREENSLRKGTSINEELFPEKSIEEVLCLLKEMDESHLDTPKFEFTRYDAIVMDKGFSEITLKNGGFTKLESETNSESESLKEKEILELENLKIQKENSDYQKSNRIKEEEILELTKDNLRLGNWDIRFRWYITISAFIIGIIVKHFIDN